MKKHKMPDMKEGGVNVTPLIDVVMCLIIFFMLVAKIGVKTGAAKMELPTTVLGKQMDELGDSVILNVTDPNIHGDDGKQDIVLDEKGEPKRRDKNPSNQPRVTAQFNPQDPEPAEVPVLNKTIDGRTSFPLKDQLAKAVDMRKKQGALDKFSVTIRAEKDLDFSMFQQVLIQCANAGVKNLNYGSVKPK